VWRVRLEPLSEAAVAELARRAGRSPAGLRALTGGNPLLVTEVLAAGDAGVPLTVRDLALARFGGLPADAQEVVRLVAVVPTWTELWLLERALERPLPAVEAAVAAGLLVASGETAGGETAGGQATGDEAVGFRHELLRRAVERTLSVLGRRELNRRVLAVLAGASWRRVWCRSADRRPSAAARTGQPPGSGPVPTWPPTSGGSGSRPGWMRRRCAPPASSSGPPPWPTTRG
jgi:hypothetical protein